MSIPHHPSARSPARALPVVGWREWVSLAALHVPYVKAKVDTGARTSSLHAFDLERFQRGGREWVRFEVHPWQRSHRDARCCEVEVLEERKVRSSNGQTSMRPVIVTEVDLAGQRFPIELTLAPRDAMGFRMLLGRQAIRGRFVVHPGRSFLGGIPTEVRRKRKKKKRTKTATRKTPRRSP